jgi:peroxiredoxin
MRIEHTVPPLSGGFTMSKALIVALDGAFQRARHLDVSLNDRLQKIVESVRELSPEFAEAVDRLIARLRDCGVGVAAPAPGDPMPPFLLPDEQGRLVALEDLLELGPVAVAFHRGHWCPYCRLNSFALAQALERAMAEGGQIVAITPDRTKFTAALKSETGGKFPILTDLDNGYALSLNLVIWVGRELQEMIAAAGADVPTYQGNDAWMLPIPATFVVGKHGIITARHIDPDYRKRMEIDDLLTALSEAR